MPVHENEALRQVALKVLAHHTGPAATADAIAAAAQRAYDDLARVSAQLIGQAGVDALTGRTLHLEQLNYPWLVHRREPEQPDGPFAQVVVCLKGQDPAVALDAAAAVFATVAGLLVTFIGAPITTQLLRRAWPEAFSTAGGEEHKA